MAVLFADVVGSSKLYETLGDAQAKRLVDECIGAMRGMVGRHRGRVVKTIGDELMCVLPDAAAGFLAACDMQRAVMELPTVGKVKRAVRIGFHAGPVIEDDNDVFGDTVNLAARMVGFAKGQQIVTSGATQAMLPPLMRVSTRRIAAFAVKGKGDEVEMCDVVWQADPDVTNTSLSVSPELLRQKPVKLLLRFDGQEWLLDRSDADFIVGREAGCQLVVHDLLASRRHARIERRRDAFVLVDQSTNGTFVTFVGDAEITLRREEVMLRGQGWIACGRSVAESPGDAVEFSVLG